MTTYPDLRDFVLRCGGELVNGGREARVPGPGHSKRDRSLSLRLADDGRVIFNDFSGKHSFMEIKSHLGLADRDYKPDKAEQEASRRRHEAEKARQEVEKLDFCATVWEGAEAAAGTVVERYLAARGFTLDCSDVRFHPGAPRAVPWNRMSGDPAPPPPHPAMICLARNVRREARGLHITFLNGKGQKAFGHRSRIMAGPMLGAALQTAPVSPDGVLAIAEGMETAGSFSILHGVPTWAAFSTSGIRGFQVPYSVRKLIIAADNDANEAGLQAAEDLAARARSRCSVEIFVPERVGDWNDVLVERRAAHA